MTPLKFDNSSLFGTDGSGNQRKVWLDGHLLKINSKWREATKEVDAAVIAEVFGIECAKYEKVTVMVDGEARQAVITPSFLNKGEEIEVSVSEILDLYDVQISMQMSAVAYIEKTIEAVHKFTEISEDEVLEWLYQMLVFDFLICNNDRHLTNFGVIQNEKTHTFRLEPLFDNGQSFLGTDAVLTKSQYEARCHKHKTKPFSTNPKKNLGDLSPARSAFEKMMKSAGGKTGLRKLPIGEGHKKILLWQVERIEGILDINPYQETLYLNSIPQMAESILQSSDETNGTVYDPGEEW